MPTLTIKQGKFKKKQKKNCRKFEVQEKCGTLLRSILLEKKKNNNI